MAGKRVSSALWLTLGGLGFVAALCLWGVFIAFKQGGGSPIGMHGWIAMALAVGLGGGVSAGLMWLMFYSAKKGVDDDVSKFD